MPSSMYQEIGSQIVPSRPAAMRRFVAGSAVATGAGYAMQASGYAQDLKEYAPIVKRGLDYANSVGKDALMNMAGQMTRAANEYQGLSDPKRHRPTPKSGVNRKLDFQEKSAPRLEDKKRSRSAGSRQTKLPYKSAGKYRRPLAFKKKWAAPVRRKRKRRSKFGF